MFSVYGPGQALDNAYQGVLGIFMGKLLRGEAITIFGDGEQTRDFVYIDDIVDGWVRALGYEGRGNVFNLGSGHALSIKQLVAHTIEAFGTGSTGHKIQHAPARPGEQRTVQADISRARAELGWEPRTPFATGLAETMRQARIVFEAERTSAVPAGKTR
jgi:UDP-glucose 4-epimerase